MPIGIPTPYGGGLLSPSAGYGGGFGGFSPLTNFGLGLLAKSGPSLTPQSPWSAIGQAGAFAGEQFTQAQQQAMQNELMRAKLGERQIELARQEQLRTLLGETTPPPESGISPALWKGLVSAAPEEAAKGMFTNVFQDPASRAATELSRAQLAELTAKTKAATGETLGETVGTLGNVRLVGDISERLEKSPLFAAGGLIDQYGVAPIIAGGLKTAKGFGAPIDQGLIDDATDLGILDKATSALATNLQSVSPNLSRSQYALKAIQQAVAAKMPWAAKREVLTTNLAAVFADIDEQGLGDKVPEYKEMKELYEIWSQQNETYGDRRRKGGEDQSQPSTLGYSREGGLSVQPPTGTPGPQAGVPGYAGTAPPAAPEVSGDELFQYAPPAGQAAPAAPARVPQLRYAPSGEPQFRSFSEVKRAEKNGWLNQARATGIWVGGKHYSWQPE